MLYELPCPRCHGPVSADSDFVGRRVRCPLCKEEFELPPPNAPVAPYSNPASTPTTDTPAGSPAVPATAPPTRFSFRCARCDSVLEAHTGISGRQAKCPTCATAFLVPQFDHAHGTVGPVLDPSGEPQDPTPVHAYAASGGKAPAIIHRADGRQAIRCPRCEQEAPIDADRCDACGLPFTLEGVAARAAPGGTNGYAVASLVLALIGMPCFVLLVPQVLAIFFAIVALRQIHREPRQRGGGLAWAGITIGTISLLVSIAALFLSR